MRLRVDLPTRAELDEAVVKVTAEAQDGWFCLLPRHADFVSALVPGLLAYETPAGDEVFVAVDGGVLIKCGDDVRISTARATCATDLARLREQVADFLRVSDEQERQARLALEKMSVDFIRRYLELEDYGRR